MVWQYDTVKQCHLHVTMISNSAKIEQSMNKSKKLLTELNSILGLGSFWKQKKSNCFHRIIYSFT